MRIQPIPLQSTICFNALSAIELARTALPDQKDWVVWTMGPDPAEGALRAFVGEGVRMEGRIGEWTWKRVPSPLSGLHFWTGDIRRTNSGGGWIGMLEVTGPAGERFHLFSYPNLQNAVGREYLVTSSDLEMLRRFADDVAKALYLKPDDRMIHIDVMGGPDVVLDSQEQERLFIAPDMLADVESQVHAFFGGAALYARLKAPHRRGFLFTGLPGNGKTLLVRHIVRLAYRHYKPHIRYLTIRADLDADQLAIFFARVMRNQPSILILEDLDSLTTETRVTKAQLLSKLDGMDLQGGSLVLATTNHPDRIDAALVHRPSRFDRVWRLPLPDTRSRLAYLREAFPDASARLLRDLVTHTGGWSYAYLKELRISAAIEAAHNASNVVSESHIRHAHKLLAVQFKSGEKLHVEPEPPVGGVGFAIDDIERELEGLCA